MHQHRERIVDVDEFAGRLRDPFRNFPDKLLRRTGARQSVEQGMSARIAELVDAVTEAREALAERNALPDDGSHIAIDQRPARAVLRERPLRRALGLSAPPGRQSSHHRDLIRSKPRSAR